MVLWPLYEVRFTYLMKVKVIFVNFLLSYGSFMYAFICNFPLLTSSSSLGRSYTQTCCFSCPATFLLHALQTYVLFLAMQYGPGSLHVRSCGIEYQYGGRKTGYRTYHFDLDYTPSKCRKFLILRSKPSGNVSTPLTCDGSVHAERF